MKIIFCDTNIIFGLLKRICLGEEIHHSIISYLSQKNTIYISTFVLKEAERNLNLKYNIILKDNHIELFLKISGCLLMDSNILRLDSIPYINDLMDAQILQDAIDIEADFLITKNIKDFDIRGVYEHYHIKITGEIPAELL